MAAKSDLLPNDRSTGMALLDALEDAGVEYIFANFGSDHSSIIESLAQARHERRELPKVITCPHEMVAMSAAHGYAQVTGRAQAVFVHVECGTQSLAGAVHNAAKGRVPVFVFAGASPFTQRGELKGSRSEFIQWIQDVHDQRGIVRGYMRYDNELRSGANVRQIVFRAMQFAHSDPKGPVYLVGPREVMESDAPSNAQDATTWHALEPRALAPQAAHELAQALDASRAPLIVTSYLGRHPAAVGLLLRLCERIGAGVLESVPSAMNFPHDNPLYLGNQWNEKRQNEALAEADLVLVIDSDVPWIPLVNAPRPDAAIYHIDVDPLKEQMPLWDIPARRQFAADAATALSQILAALDDIAAGASRAESRRAFWSGLSRKRREALDRLETHSGKLTPEVLTAAVRERLKDDVIVLSEGVTNFHIIANHLRPTRPGSLFTSGGGSLGWTGGAAVGAKLAAPDKTVAVLVGDGSYMFSVPSTVHWMARRYEAPFLTVIYNNGGWNAPRFSTLGVHPGGFASRESDLDLSFAPQPDYSGIAAAAGGALPIVVNDAGGLSHALDRAFHAVQVEKRCAVIDARLAS